MQMKALRFHLLDFRMNNLRCTKLWYCLPPNVWPLCCWSTDTLGSGHTLFVPGQNKSSMTFGWTIRPDQHILYLLHQQLANLEPIFLCFGSQRQCNCQIPAQAKSPLVSRRRSIDSTHKPTTRAGSNAETTFAFWGGICRLFNSRQFEKMMIVEFQTYFLSSIGTNIQMLLQLH